MDVEKIFIDGTEYNVLIVWPSRTMSFEIVEGSNSGVTLDFSEVRDIGGTKYNYSMTVMPDPSAPDDFDAFLDVISAPVASHAVRMPYGQGYLDFDAMVRNGSVTDYGIKGERRVWTELQVTFTAIRPQRRPEETE